MKPRTTYACLALALTLAVGCGGYGEVSPVAYDYAMALYSLSNQKAADRVPAVAEQVEASHQAGDISDREARWLQGILSDAESGDWKSAAKQARRMMEDQVKRGAVNRVGGG